MGNYHNNNVPADPLTDFVHRTLVFIVTPSISILGIIGNTLSLIVIRKHGFSKSSNILLFSLAVSDILFMIGINGPPKPMYEFGEGGFAYSEPAAHVLHYLYQFFDSLNWTTGPTSVSIPAFITVERLIAIFMPLKFASIVTPRRAIIAVLTPFVFSVIIQIYVRMWFKFDYTFDPSRNVSVGLAARTDFYWSHQVESDIIQKIVNSFFILVIFVGTGSIAIGIKMKMVVRQRKKMTNDLNAQKNVKKEGASSRTTKMLLCLCIFYTFACFPIGLPAIMPGFMVLPVFEEKPNFKSVGVFVYHVYKLFFCINSSVNFLIFVGTNKKFRDTLMTIFSRKTRTQNAKIFSN